MNAVAGYDMWHRRRLSMKPGITGLWQVRGRRDPDFDRWVERDLLYIDENGQYLGFGDLENDGHLDFLYIAPEAEGRGVGSALYDALEAHAREVAMPKLFVEASELAKPLLERRGFVVRARNELTLGGVDIHNFSMEKLL